MAKRAFNKMHGSSRTKPSGALTKGKTANSAGTNNGLGHKAPGITSGNGKRRASQKTVTQKGGFTTGHKAAATTTGSGKRMKSQRTRHD